MNKKAKLNTIIHKKLIERQKWQRDTIDNYQTPPLGVVTLHTQQHCPQDSKRKASPHQSLTPYFHFLKFWWATGSSFTISDSPSSEKP